MANLKCGDAIDKLIRKPLLIYEVYPYILGIYLTNKTIDLTVQKKVLKNMKYLIKNLSLINPIDVFSNLDSKFKTKTFKLDK